MLWRDFLSAESYCGFCLHELSCFTCPSVPDGVKAQISHIRQALTDLRSLHRECGVQNRNQLPA